MTPSIDPVYFVMYSRLGGLDDSSFPPARYRAWLPPFDRQVVTQVAPGAPRRDFPTRGPDSPR